MSSSSEEMSRSSVDSSDGQEQAQEALAYMVCYEKVKPYSFCKTSVPFARFVNAMNPYLLSCFTFESLERNCFKVYKTEHDKVKVIFSKHGGQISLSVDSLIHEEPWERIDEYLCLCAHFIDDNWKLHKWVIKYCCVSDMEMDLAHDAILKSLQEYEIEDKIFTLTVGGIIDLADYVKENVPERNFPLDGQLFHVHCIGYVISCMVQQGFEVISEIIDKVRLLAWSKSLPLWYLTSSKLSDALELNALGEFAPGQIADYYEVPSQEEWDKVRSMCKIADRIYEITKGLFDIKRPTANLFLPHLQEIRAYLDKESTNSDAFVRLVAEKMLSMFNKNWDDMYLVLSIAAFLDPRFKMNFVEFCFCGDSRATIVLKNICKLYDGYTAQCDEKEYLLSNPNSNSELNLDSDSDSEDEEEDDYEGAEDEDDEEEDDGEDEEDKERTEKRAKKRRVTMLGNLNVVQEYCQSMQFTSQKPQKTGLVHLDMYLEEPVLPWVEDFSVLEWWKDNSSKYPQLSKMARDYLAIPMSVATSYEAYYTEPREADRTLLSLKPDLTNALKCTRSWKLGYKKSD